MVGEIVTEPPDTGVTEPMPLMEAAVALALDHVSVVEEPWLIEPAAAVSEPVAAGVTATVTCLVTVPPAQVRLSV